VTHRGPFQPLPFCDSVILSTSSKPPARSSASGTQSPPDGQPQPPHLRHGPGDVASAHKQGRLPPALRQRSPRRHERPQPPTPRPEDPRHSSRPRVLGTDVAQDGRRSHHPATCVPGHSVLLPAALPSRSGPATRTGPTSRQRAVSSRGIAALGCASTARRNREAAAWRAALRGHFPEEMGLLFQLSSCTRCPAPIPCSFQPC